MKAIRFDRFGGPEVLRMVDMPDPVPGPGEILVEVHAVSVVAGDCKLRNGEMAGRLALRPPKIPGRDGAGIVRSVGAGVAGFDPGDRVCFTCQYGEQGSYAELALRPQGDVVRMPGRLNFIEAAAVTHAGICAYIAIVETAAVKAGDRVLVHAAAGAIGGIAVQLCRMLGAEVAGTCKARNVDHVTALGAQRAIAYDREDFSSAISGQDVVIDMVGGDVHARSRRVLRPGGRLVWLIAEPFEEPDDGRDIEIRQAVIKDSPESLRAAIGLADRGRIRPLVSQVLPLYRAADAHRIMEAGENTRGRLVLDTRRLAP
ncbi:MAG: NADP-dependent oxidoreductase [Defluviicoccus sp.]|nr:NADP-dependent oxidoreductase [Defluviicoccus sp.]